MKQIAPVAPLQYAADHLTVAINLARIRGRLRKAVPTFRPRRNKARRLKARLRAAVGH